MNADQIRALITEQYPEAMNSPLAKAFAALSEPTDAAKFSLNHSSVGTRHSGSASTEAKNGFDMVIEAGWPDYEAWRESAQVGDQFPPNSVIYMERVA